MSSDDFDCAVRASTPALTRYARLLTAHSEGAEDLVQEKFARAWAARERFQFGKSFKAWTFAILRNLFLSWVQRERFKANWSEEHAQRTLVTPPTQDAAILLEQCRSAVTAFPESLREALLAVIDDHLSYEEASRRIGISLSALKSRVHRTRAAVLAHLEGGPGSSLEPDIYLGFATTDGALQMGAACVSSSVTRHPHGVAVVRTCKAPARTGSDQPDRSEGPR